MADNPSQDGRAARERRGRRHRRRARPDPAQLAALLSAPVTVGRQGGARKMSPLEASLRVQVRRALVERDLRALEYLLKLGQRHGMLEAPPAPPLAGGLLIIPRSWKRSEWMARFRRLGPPPWPGPHSGLPGDPPEP
jgi:hypothetical protein